MIPTLSTLESGPALLREGYTFVSRRCDRLHTDAFRTRLLGRPTVCARGADAARMFYGDTRFTRRGAMPASVLHLLQDEGSVQALDAEAHRRRKQIFMQTLVHGDRQGLADAFERHWRSALTRWRDQDRVRLHREVPAVLTRAALDWCGISFSEADARRRTVELRTMFERAGSLGPVNWWARAVRNRTERWGRELFDAVRAGRMRVPDGSVLDVIAGHRDDDGRPLSSAVASVELLNVLRPIVAVSLFVDFVALALLRYPQWRDRFAAGDETDLGNFVHEVRRYYPFFPLIIGRVLEPFTWREHDFGPGEAFLLDLYGTDHDPASWDEPEAFRPQRFRGRTPDPYALVAQGGGRYEDNHRCPGELVTIDLMGQATRLLTRSMRYRVPIQDLSISLRHMPTAPADGMIIQDVVVGGR